MRVMDELSSHLETRLEDLREAKEKGYKIVGYTPGGFLPEELVLAAGAIPVCLARGGDHVPVDSAHAYVCRWLDTFCRAQIGYGTSAADPYYSLLDLLAIPITDNSIRAISDVLDYNTGIEVFPFGVPHMKEASTYDYYLHGITRLKARLEELTRNEITDVKLNEAILLCNRERQLLKEISLTRRSDSASLGCKDFVSLVHGSLLADKQFMVTLLESLSRDLPEHVGPVKEGPRLLLTGSTLAMGDNAILDAIEEAGGVVAIEEFAEGLKPYWVNVTPEGDLMEALAQCYFMQRVPPAWFRPAQELRDFLVELAKDFRVSGVIWYQLMYRESYKTESYFFPEILRKEAGLPMLTVESDYDPGDTDKMLTEIEAFLDVIGGR